MNKPEIDVLVAIYRNEDCILNNLRAFGYITQYSNKYLTAKGIRVLTVAGII